MNKNGKVDIWSVAIVLGVIAIAVVVVAAIMGTQPKTTTTTAEYDAVVGETITIDLPNYANTTTFATLYNYSYEHNYSYNYSYQWDIKNLNQTQLRYMHTYRHQTHTEFQFKALKAGESNITFEYRVENQYMYVHVAHIVVTEA